MLSQKVRFPSFLRLSSVPLCKCTTAFLFYLSTDGHLGCFQILVILHRAAVNIGVHIFFWVSVLGFFGYIFLQVESLGHKAVAFLIFWGPSILFLIVVHQSAFPPTVHEGSLFSTTCSTLVCWFVYDGNSRWYEVVSHCGFNLHLSDG